MKVLFYLAAFLMALASGFFVVTTTAPLGGRHDNSRAAMWCGQAAITFLVGAAILSRFRA